MIAFRQSERAAWCLHWPNLSQHNPEHFRSPFPTSIKNKMLIIAEQNNPENSYEGVLSTHEYVGINNAHILVHDALGLSIDDNPNNCTYDAVSNFYLNGDITFTRL